MHKFDFSNLLLFDVPPYMVIPPLANAIGLKPSIVIQQLHYKLRQDNLGKKVGREKWFHNTFGQWHEEFPFISVRCLKGIFKSLAKRGLIKSRNDLNRDFLDKTMWYTIDYDQMDVLGHVIFGDAPPARKPSVDYIVQELHDAECSPVPEELPTETEKHEDPPEIDPIPSVDYIVQELHDAECQSCTTPLDFFSEISIEEEREEKSSRAHEENIGEETPKTEDPLVTVEEVATPPSPVMTEHPTVAPITTEMPIPDCSVFDAVGIRRYNMQPCDHVSKTLALFDELGYPCNTHFWRDDPKERVHMFAHKYDLDEQRSYIRYRISSDTDKSGNWLSPSTCLSAGYVASGIAEALIWARTTPVATLAGTPAMCKHPAHALRHQDGHILCSECGEDQGEELPIEEMTQGIAELLRGVERKAAMETIIGARVDYDVEPLVSDTGA